MEQEQTKPQAEPQTVKPKKQKAKEFFAKYFTATRMAYLALFTALSFVFRMPYLEFPIIPAVPFLKVDFSGVFVMIAGFSLGPVAAVIVSVFKELLYALSFTQTVGIGELANILITLPYILIPTLIYKKHKGIKSVLISIAVACLCQAVWSFPVNYVLTFPFFGLEYMGYTTWGQGMNFYLSVWYWAVLFNFVKVILVSAATLLLYKSISRLIKMTSEKFEKRDKKQPAGEEAYADASAKDAQTENCDK